MERLWKTFAGGFWMLDVRIRPALPMVLAGLMMLLPIPLVFAAMAAACFHELCHLAALKLLGHPVFGVELGPLGARIVTEELEPLDELTCALAGPLGALLLLFVARWVPLVALFAVAHSAWNLIPLYPMDGGRAVACFLKLLGIGEGGIFLFSLLTCLAVAGAGLLAGSRWGPLPLILSEIILAKWALVAYNKRRIK